MILPNDSAQRDLTKVLLISSKSHRIHRILGICGSTEYQPSQSGFELQVGFAKLGTIFQHFDTLSYELCMKLFAMEFSR